MTIRIEITIRMEIELHHLKYQLKIAYNAR